MSATDWSIVVSGGKAVVLLFELWTEPAAFFDEREISFLFEKATDKLVIQTWVFGPHFLKNE